MELMNEETKHEFLGKLLPDGEMYLATAWGCIRSGGPTPNQYCYMGMTESSLCFACVNNVNPGILTGGFNIPLAAIQKKKVRKGLFGSSILSLTVKEGTIKVSLSRNVLGSKLDKNAQVSGVDYMVSHLS